MRKVEVKGEIKAIACREGSSGIFSGDIAGLYQGYRFGSSAPDEREFVLDLPHGSIAVRLVQQIVTPLPPRPSEHPFANGNDPFVQATARSGAYPHPSGTPAGPPGGPSGHGGPPAPARREAPGMGGEKATFERVHYMETKLVINPDKCTGIFSGTCGELELVPPNYRMPGHLIINTSKGDLRLEFLEVGDQENLRADLSVDGANSTGFYKNARGELQFSLKVVPPFWGTGTYSGTMWLDDSLAA